MLPFRYLLPCFLCSLFLLAGCGFDRVGFELADYVNQDVLGIRQLETKALESYAAATGPNYTSDRALHDALEKRVVPLYGRFVYLLRQIRPENEEIRRLHAAYVEGAESMYRGFQTMQLALETRDAALMRSANSNIQNGRRDIEKWHGRLLSLYQQHGLRSAKDSKPSAIERMIIEPQGY